MAWELKTKGNKTRKFLGFVKKKATTGKWCWFIYEDRSYSCVAYKMNAVDFELFEDAWDDCRRTMLGVKKDYNKQITRDKNKLFLIQEED